MTEPGAGYEQGAPGDPGQPQLAQGEAAQLNQPAPEQQPPAEAPSAAGAGPEPVPPGVGDQPAPAPAFSPQSEDEKFLFAPPDPEEEGQHILTGLGPQGQIAPPPDVAQWLPALQEAAADPSAPDNVRLLFSLISNSLGQ